MTDQVAEEVVKRYDKLEGERGTWDAHWREIAERVLPRYNHTFNRPTSTVTRGEKRTEKMFDATAALGLERFAAAMESMLTPRNSRWHRVLTTNSELNKDRETKLFFEEVTNILFKHRNSPRANHASQQHEVYIGLGAFGTSAIHIDHHDEGGLRYAAIDLREILFDMSHQGVVDTSYRKFTMTGRQMKQRSDRRGWLLPDQVTSTLKDDPDKTFEVIHCVRPRGEVQVGRADFRGKKFASLYVSVDGRTVLSEGGFNTFPYPISRYVTGPGEIYGRSPAMLALPAIKVLNEIKKTTLMQGHRTVNPVLLSHDDGVLDTVSLKPGAMNPGGVSAEGRALVHALPVGNLAAGQELMDMEKAVINDAFLVTLFQILVETPTMTATEVLERAREKGALLSPTMGRQQSEMLGPMIEREIDLLSQQGVMPELPGALIEADGEFDIEYDSPLSRSQRSEEAAGWLRTLEAAIAYANTTQDVSVLDHFDTDIIYPALGEINAMPASWTRGKDAVASIRENRAQAQQTQQMIDAAPAAAGVMKALQ